MGTNKRLAGPAAMAASPTNIFNGPRSEIITTVRHVHILNKTGAPVTFSIFLGTTGASAAGTEVMGSGTVVAANKPYDWYGALDMLSTDYLVGLASAAASLTITVEGDQRVL